MRIIPALVVGGFLLFAQALCAGSTAQLAEVIAFLQQASFSAKGEISIQGDAPPELITVYQNATEEGIYQRVEMLLPYGEKDVKIITPTDSYDSREDVLDNRRYAFDFLSKMPDAPTEVTEYDHNGIPCLKYLISFEGTVEKLELIIGKEPPFVYSIDQLKDGENSLQRITFNEVVFAPIEQSLFAIEETPLSILRKAMAYSDKASFKADVPGEGNRLPSIRYQKYDNEDGFVYIKMVNFTAATSDLINRDGVFSFDQNNNELIKRGDLKPGDIKSIPSVYVTADVSVKAVEVVHDGKPCWKLTVHYPKVEAARFSQIVLIVDKETYFPYQGTFYNPEGVELSFPSFVFKNVEIDPVFPDDLFDTPKGAKEVTVNSLEELISRSHEPFIEVEGKGYRTMIKIAMICSVLALSLIVVLVIVAKRKNR